MKKWIKKWIKKLILILNELKNWLKNCKYPENVINRAFRNARLQSPAPLKTNSNNIPFVTSYYDNVNNNEKVKKIRRKFNDIQSDHLKKVLKNSNSRINQHISIVEQVLPLLNFPCTYITVPWKINV